MITKEMLEARKKMLEEQLYFIQGALDAISELLVAYDAPIVTEEVAIDQDTK